jgi:hypothetical protein
MPERDCNKRLLPLSASPTGKRALKRSGQDAGVLPFRGAGFLPQLEVHQKIPGPAGPLSGIEGPAGILPNPTGTGPFATL